MVFVIAEVGINHNGDINIAKKLIDIAVRTGCDAVKFQKRTVEKVYSKEILGSPRESPWGTTTREQKLGLEFDKKEYDIISNYAKEKGIDFIICDHHRPGPELPKAVAVLDPKRDDCPYPFKELCGCGVGFKLAQALAANRGQTITDLLLYLDLVATAIGADIVPITGENRILAHYGLKVINGNPRVGFQAILQQVKKQQLTITDVVFLIAPRINAAGRMKHGNHAVTLLVETDIEKAVTWAAEIEQFNTDRRDADKRITEEALVQISENEEQERLTTVVYDQNWHKGVIGIVASRLTETYYRPTLVFTKSGEKLAASARSVKGFDVYNALESCSEHIEQFGGHKYAAGLTLFENDYEKFTQALGLIAQEWQWDMLRARF